MRCSYLLLTVVLLAGCDSGAGGERDVLTGSYDQVFLRVTVGGQTVLEGLAGVYVDEVLSFEEGGGLAIEYLSDFGSEGGRAEGRYSVEGDAVVFHISTSSTSVYPAGSEVRYDGFATLGPTFLTAYEVDGQREFRGPGLVLKREGVDEEDLDGDGDRSEALVQEYFYATVGTP